MITFGGKEPTDIYIGGKEVETISINNDVVYQKVVDTTDYFYIKNTNSSQLSGTITLTTTDDGNVTSQIKYATSIEYSTDKSIWTTIALTAGQSQTISINYNQTVYFRNDSGYFNYLVGGGSLSGIYTKFSCNRAFKAGGDLMTLVDYTDLNHALEEGSFAKIFQGATHLNNITDLRISKTSSLQQCVFAYAFENTNIALPMELPNIGSLPAYALCATYSNCDRLTKTPNLSNIGIYDSLDSAFYGCTALQTVYMPAESSWDNYYAKNWLKNAGTSATNPVAYLYNPFDTIDTSDSGIPSRFTRIPSQYVIDSASFTEDSDSDWLFDLELDSNNTFATIASTYPNYTGEIIYSGNTIQFDNTDVTSATHLQLVPTVAPSISPQTTTMNIYDSNNIKQIVSRTDATVTWYVPPTSPISNLTFTQSSTAEQYYASADIGYTGSWTSLEIKVEREIGDRFWSITCTPSQVTSGHLDSTPTTFTFRTYDVWSNYAEVTFYDNGVMVEQVNVPWTAVN